MTFNLIVSQGRAADRSASTIAGAAMTAEALERRFGVGAIRVGRPSPPVEDDWTESLPQAGPTLVAVAGAIAKSVANGRPTILVANTCSVSLASLPVVVSRFPDALVLWIDAHGDFNTPTTTGTGYLGGMVVAAACGLWDSGHGSGLMSDRVILVGARDVDAQEAVSIRNAGVRIIAPSAFSPEVLLEMIGERKVWIHVDWDVLEPGHVPADYDVPGGLLPDQLRAMLGALPSGSVVGLELAEFRPSDDPERSRLALETIVETVAPLLDRF